MLYAAHSTEINQRGALTANSHSPPPGILPGSGVVSLGATTLLDDPSRPQEMYVDGEMYCISKRWIKAKTSEC